jgi:hypothetical protein
MYCFDSYACIFLCNNALSQHIGLQSDVFVLANIWPVNIYCFCVTINFKLLIKLIVCHFLPVYFVPNYYPDRLSVALVYFCSCYQILYIVSVFYNEMLLVDQFYCYDCACILLFLTNIQTICQLCLHIFVLDNKLPDYTIVSVLQ